MSNQNYSSQAKVVDPIIKAVCTRIRLLAKRRLSWMQYLWSTHMDNDNNNTNRSELDLILDHVDNQNDEQAWAQSNRDLEMILAPLTQAEETLAADSQSPLALFSRIFELNPVEIDILHLCLAHKIEPALSQVFADLQGQANFRAPTDHLVARLFFHRLETILTADSPLLRWQCIEQRETHPGEPSQIFLDESITTWLLGGPYVDKVLIGKDTISQVHSALDHWPLEETVNKLRQFLKQEKQEQLRICILGQPGSGRRSFAHLTAQSLNVSLVAYDSEKVESPLWQDFFIHAQRYAFITGCAPGWLGQKAVTLPWPQVPVHFPIQFIICTPADVLAESDDFIDHRIHMPPTTDATRKKLWRTYVPQSTQWSTYEMDKLLSRHNLNIGTIVKVGRHAPENAREASKIIRELTGKAMGDVAIRMECPFTLQDLIVPHNILQTMEDFIFEAGAAPAFWERPEAARLFPQGKGLSALFAGPSGTGKTMAAQIIAQALDRELYRIDLSAVVSKYVGETSKNISRIFTLAEQLDVVLLFDEADALFGKRTEIKDSHDRYANTDTNYLLQAIESYIGTVILTTNKKGNIDEAFTRRIRYILSFPKPDAKQRLQIWRMLVSELAGRKVADALDAELLLLADELDITGSQIKFSILAALFFAARDGKALNMEHLLRGLERELGKEGHTFSKRERERLLSHGK